MKTDPRIEELIDKALVEHGYSRSDFSKNEIAELRSEIIAEENGASILDGFCLVLVKMNSPQCAEV